MRKIAYAATFLAASAAGIVFGSSPYAATAVKTSLTSMSGDKNGTGTGTQKHAISTKGSGAVGRTKGDKGDGNAQDNAINTKGTGSTKRDTTQPQN